MKTQKRIRYRAKKSPMQVLHAFVPEMDIDGFARERVSIFEGDCCAHILFEQKSQQSQQSQQSMAAKHLNLPLGKQKPPVRFSLRLTVSAHNVEQTEFNIVSEIVPIP